MMVGHDGYSVSVRSALAQRALKVGLCHIIGKASRTNGRRYYHHHDVLSRLVRIVMLSIA